MIACQQKSFGKTSRYVRSLLLLYQNLKEMNFFPTEIDPRAAIQRRNLIRILPSFVTQFTSGIFWEDTRSQSSRGSVLNFRIFCLRLGSKGRVPQLTLSPGVPGTPFCPGSPFAPLFPSSPGGPGAPGVPFSPWQQQKQSQSVSWKSQKTHRFCMGKDSGFRFPWRKSLDTSWNHLHARLLGLDLLLHHPYQGLPKK